MKDFTELQQRLDEFDEVLARALAGTDKHGQPVRKPTCTKGCAFCCEEPVYVTPADVWIMLDQLDEFERAIVRERTIAWLRRAQELKLTALHGAIDATKYRSFRLPCPFLEGNLCMAYRQRPLSCRSFIACGPVENCRSLLKRPRQVFLQIPELFARAHDATLAAISRIEDVGDTADYTHLGYILALEFGLIEREQIP